MIGGQNMKELMLLVGFGAGLVTGALLYKHSQDAKNLVNKSEKAVKKEMQDMKDKVKPKNSNIAASLINIHFCFIASLF